MYLLTGSVPAAEPGAPAALDVVWKQGQKQADAEKESARSNLSNNKHFFHICQQKTGNKMKGEEWKNLHDEKKKPEKKNASIILKVYDGGAKSTIINKILLNTL